MKRASTSTFTTVALAVAMFGQNSIPTFQAQARSAFVWGEDSPGGAESSIVQDPLTGNAIPRLSYAGIEVTSRMGFENIGAGEAGAFLNYATTIVNSTGAGISVRYGGIAIDGQAAAPLSVVPTKEKLRKKHLQAKADTVELEKLYCFRSNFLSSEMFFEANASTQVFVVGPGSASTVSSVTRIPQDYAVRCATKGCHPTGTIRYYVRINSQDYVFVWPGRSVAYCGR
jgi:hypothetical protein